MRTCGQCGNLDKRKNPPCKLGLPCVKSEKTGEYIRPSKCKKKAVKAKLARERALKNAKETAIDSFQMWVRYRDNWTCVVCGKHIDPDIPGAKQEMHAGHYISRKYKSLLLDPKNVHAQCKDCNGRQNWEGMDPRYTQYMIRRYGPEILDYLFQKQHEITKISHTDWLALAEKWSQKLEEIKKDLTKDKKCDTI